MNPARNYQGSYGKYDLNETPSRANEAETQVRPFRSTASETEGIGPGNPADGADSFADDLRKLVAQAGPHSLQAGTITLLGLDRVKERFGAQWPRVEQNVHRIVRNVIKRHLASGDIFSNWRDTAYVLVFGSLAQDEARVKCRLLASEIGKALLGAEGGDYLTVKSAVATLDGSFALTEMPSIDELLQSSTVVATDIAEDLELVLATATGAEASEPPKTAPANNGPQREPVPHFLYHPMWDTAHRAVAIYLCAPLLGGVDTNAIEHDADFIYRLDMLTQERVLAYLATLVERKHKLLITLPIHFETLSAGATRRAFAESFDRISSEALSLLVIEALRVPEGVPQSRLVDLLAPFRRKCRAVVFRLSIKTTDFDAFRAAGVHTVGCDLRECDLGEPIKMRQMISFKRHADRAKLETFIRGVDSTSLAAAAVGSGFRYLEGEAIVARKPYPNGVFKFELFDVYKPIALRRTVGRASANGV